MSHALPGAGGKQWSLPSDFPCSDAVGSHVPFSCDCKGVCEWGYEKRYFNQIILILVNADIEEFV